VQKRAAATTTATTDRQRQEKIVNLHSLIQGFFKQIFETKKRKIYFF